MAVLGPALVAQEDGGGRELIGDLDLKEAALDGTWTKVDDGVRLVTQQGGRVRVYVKGSSTPCLDVEQLSDLGTGKVGLWFNGNASFRNLKITPAP